jgi:hypothetical protein
MVTATVSSNLSRSGLRTFAMQALQQGATA